MKTFISIDGQSIYDVCLNTYGSLDYLGKLMIDNDIQGVNEYLEGGMVFFYDDNLVLNQGILQLFADSGITFSTQVEEKVDSSTPSGVLVDENGAFLIDSDGSFLIDL